MTVQLDPSNDDEERRIERLRHYGLPPDAPTPNPHSAFTLRKRVIAHPEFAYAVRQLADAHLRFKRSGQAQGLAFVGQSGSGKSTALEFYASKFPFRRHGTVRHMPVLRVLTPESPTVKTLAQAFLDAMEAPSEKGTAQEKTNRIIKYVRQCGVEIIAIDEFQHFFEGSRATKPGRAIADWLKNLLSACNVVVVIVGLPKSVLVLNGSQQLRRRFASTHYMKPFKYVTDEEQEVFQAVLQHVQSELPCPCIALGEPETARCFYFASQGLIDYVIKLVEGAVWRGGSGPDGELQLSDFAEAFRDQVWKDCPDGLNPFVPGATLRALTKRNEPFEGWDDIDQYVLSQEAQALLKKSSTDKRRGDRHA